MFTGKEMLYFQNDSLYLQTSHALQGRREGVSRVSGNPLNFWMHY